MERDTQEGKERKEGESVLGVAPRAAVCHHICIKPVSVSGSTCWLSGRQL